VFVPNGIFPRNLNKETVPSRERTRAAESRFDAGLRSHRGSKLEIAKFRKASSYRSGNNEYHRYFLGEPNSERLFPWT
jgi:hypothetical protein